MSDSPTLSMYKDVGLKPHMETSKKIKTFLQIIEDDFVWLNEILVEAKRSFTTPDVQLLPKTPSAKRTRKQRRCDTEDDDDDFQKPKKKAKKGRPKKGNNTSTDSTFGDHDTSHASTASIDSTDMDASDMSAKSSRSTRSTRSSAKARNSKTGSSRSSRAQKVKLEEERETEEAEPVFSMNVSLAISQTIPEESESDSDQTSARKNKDDSIIILEDESPVKTKVDIVGDKSATRDVVKTSKKSKGSIGKKVQLNNSGEKIHSPHVGKSSPHVPNAIPNFSQLNVKGKVQAIEEFGSPVATGAIALNGKCSTPISHISAVKTPQVSLSHTPGDPPKPAAQKQSRPQAAPTHTADSDGDDIKQRSSRRSSQCRRQGSSHGLRKSLSHRRSSARRSGHSLHGQTGSLSSIRKSLSRRCSSRLSSSSAPCVSLTKLSAKDYAPYSAGTERTIKVISKSTPKTSQKNNKGSTSTPSQKEKNISPLKAKLQMNKNNRMKQLQEIQKQKSPLGTPGKRIGQVIQVSSAEEGSSTDVEQAQPKRSTRSKMRHNKPPPPALASEDEDEEEGAPSGSAHKTSTPVFATPEPPKRTTRSKVRQNKPPPKLATPSCSEDELDDGSAASSGSANAPLKSAKSKMRKLQNAANQSPFTDLKVVRPNKRAAANEPSGASPPKKPCRDIGSGEESPIEIIGNTPSPQCPRNKVVRPTPGSAQSFMSGMRKRPQNLNSTINSFINRNSPKKVDAQTRIDQKRKELEMKQIKENDRILKRQKEMQKRAEENRKRREEKLQAAAKRREDQRRKEVEMKKGISQKFEDRKNTTIRAHDEKLKEEKERQRMLRDKRLAEVEQKRKQEEESRQKKQMEMEAEQRRQQEEQRRRREQEEQERQRRQVEARRLEEQRRAEAERERLAEQERLRLQEEQLRREEQDRQRQKEERERKEKEERERVEREKQKEKERIRQEELEKQREIERQKLKEEEAQREKDRKAREEEKLIKANIEKHNHSLQQNTSINKGPTTMNTPLKTACPTQKAKLNTTITKEQPSTKPSATVTKDDCESYPITPARVHRLPSDSNYCIDDIRSDDSTDDEEKPRKRIPSWAVGANLKAALISQHYHPPNLEELWGFTEMPDLKVIFPKKHRPRFHKRTSSAVWDSPMLKHTQSVA